MFTEKFSIGVDEPKNQEEEPFQFYSIISMDSDKDGNIYVLDYSAKCVKKFDREGRFVKRFFRQGKGPKEVANPFSISINTFTNHMFILQDYGFTIKEFDLAGEYVNYHVLPKQFFGDFHFLEPDVFVFSNTTPKLDRFNNFLKVSLGQKKIVSQFAPTNMEHVLNHKQRFAVARNSVLWTSRGDAMKLIAFDLDTGIKVQEIQIPGTYKKNKFLEVKGGIEGSSMVTPIFYNVAQPFVIDDQLFALIIVQQYQEQNGKTAKFPSHSKRIIYQVNGSHFEKLGEVDSPEGIYVGTVSKNRLILFSNEPYGRIKSLEFTKEKTGKTGGGAFE